MPKNDYRVFQDFLISSSKINQLQFLKMENKQELLLCNNAITAMLLVIIKGKKFVYNIGCNTRNKYAKTT